MASHPRISQLLVETGAYRDLEHPVILTSGKLGIYYINTEKLLQDGGEWERVIKQDPSTSAPVIQHASRMVDLHPTFGEVVEIMANEIKTVEPEAIAGGERRDWLFSGPVATMLGLPHISLFKSGETYELIVPDVPSSHLTHNMKVVHVSDLLTTGSSSYDDSGSEPRGWIPQLRKFGATVSDSYAVVTRFQGGEEALFRGNVQPHYFVAIDEDFLGKNSKFSVRALEYLNTGAEDWGYGYIVREGIARLVPEFAPDKLAKDRRGVKFLQIYRDALQAPIEGRTRLEELAEAVGKAHNVNIYLLE